MKYKNLHIAKILLNNGANVNAKNNDGHTALPSCCCVSRPNQLLN
ncbi:ankyrin repeat-containing protein [Orientia tsutsugamushi]|uniref:Ankyrin repeat protein with 1 ankyrin repeats n=1 Tax=Orientia tsutsugamushi (strain Boryong) TaxID=357244 RepID=A5CF44_ORITB|nr:ankyrin repeat-containing protein [Orientia tsutsugamushi]CAM80918.1 ankyrin repeat protein with 1 ankyrin repeats [Orientia tsutsugamushi str. Boryong]